MITVLSVFGTRPEAIKLAPVIRELEARPAFRTVSIASGQHTDLLYPFLELFGLRLDHDLKVMRPGQNPSGVAARVLSLLDPILQRQAPDVVLVQGDTTTAFAASLAAFHRGIPVAHVEAGLRSGDPLSPFPEEMNRRLISRIASLHFAATARNRRALLSEGVEAERIVVTGNPVVDAVQHILRTSRPGPDVRDVLSRTQGARRLVLTTHRRESFGAPMAANLRVLRRFVEEKDDVALLFPVHPNPAVRAAAERELHDHPRVHLLPPLDYPDFVALLSEAWLIVSDSGGVQEEVPTLGKFLLVLRENTERPEVLRSGHAALVGGKAERLAALLRAFYRDGARRRTARTNPFGSGDAAVRIASALAERFAGRAAAARRSA